MPQKRHHELDRVLQKKLFDDLIGLGKQQLRHSKAEGFCGLQVDHQPKFGRLLDRKVGRISSFEYFVHEHGGLAIQRRFVVPSSAD